MVFEGAKLFGAAARVQQKNFRRRCYDRNYLIYLARPAGLEPATYGFEVRRSIQLSYGRTKA
jgi:hypothetical protein